MNQVFKLETKPFIWIFFSGDRGKVLRSVYRERLLSYVHYSLNLSRFEIKNWIRKLTTEKESVHSLLIEK